VEYNLDRYVQPFRAIYCSPCLSRVRTDLFLLFRSYSGLIQLESVKFFYVLFHVLESFVGDCPII